jgi:SchA/CurD like domain
MTSHNERNRIMQQHSLLFRIKPGSEARVAEILAGYDRPATVVDDHTRLLRTTVFMHGTVVVRVMDIEGSMQKVAAHLSRQPQIQTTEQALNPSLAEPRNLGDPTAVGAFFRRAMMHCLVDRRLPIQPGDETAITRHALLYPLRRGTGGAADHVFQAGGDPPPQAGGTRLHSTTVFRHEDTIVRLFEITGDLDEAIEHLVRATALQSAGQGLAEFLDAGVDLTSQDGLRTFVHEQLMSVVTDRRAVQAA